MKNNELSAFRIFFIVAALWNLAGGIPGYYFSVDTFQMFFGKELVDPLMISIYKGAWGTTLLYFFGYLFVAFNPEKHTGIVILGVIGKIFFAASLLKLYLAGLTTTVVMAVVIGDSLFTLFLLFFLARMLFLRKAII
ncbi:MAG: hypothetical protein ABW168_13510 [Sedimenticola sp.]